MSNSDFEKQVQQKMDELNFVPSDLVWRGVEKQINERKERRRVLLWLPFLLLLGGAVWMYKINTGTGNRQQQLIKIKTPAPAENKVDAGTASNNNPVEKKTDVLPAYKKLPAPAVENTAIKEKPAAKHIYASVKNKLKGNKNNSKQVAAGKSAGSVARTVEQKHILAGVDKDKPAKVKTAEETNEA
jgi:hypothetical protein